MPGKKKKYNARFPPVSKTFNQFMNEKFVSAFITYYTCKVHMQSKVSKEIDEFLLFSPTGSDKEDNAERRRSRQSRSCGPRDNLPCSGIVC